MIDTANNELSAVIEGKQTIAEMLKKIIGHGEQHARK